MRLRGLTSVVLVPVVLTAGVVPAGADTTAQSLPFAQDWSNLGLITADDDWSGVPGVIGYRGDDLTTATGTDPQTITADGSTTPVDVNASQTNPNTFATGGVAEFHLADPSVALNGSGTADAPHVVVSLATTGFQNVTFAYTARDLDGSVDNAVQQVATQYRIGPSGPYTNLPSGYLADATAGPSLSGLATPVEVTLPADANDKPLVQLRVITANAVGNDEWVGVDDITAEGDPIPGDPAPAVTDVDPASGASAGVDTNIAVTFSEPVNVVNEWFDITCTTSGSVTAVVSGGPTTFTLDPAAAFANGEACTVTIFAAGVTDQDQLDPPDSPVADFVSSFTIVPTIAQVQGAAHISPRNGQSVSGVEGIVTARRTAGGRGVWIQDPTPDDDPATSDAVFVFLNANPVAQIGDSVEVSGMVSEFRPGGDPDNLTITQITSTNGTVTIRSSGNTPPAPTVLGLGGRLPPTETIDDDGAGNVETGGVFDPADDAIDFYESIEGMILRVNGGAVVGPTRSFGEITLLPDTGAWATGLRTPRGGILLGGYADPNPERITVDDEILRDIAPTPRPAKAMPDMNVGDVLTSAVVGPLDYSFSNYKIQATSTPTFSSAGLVRETTPAPTDHQVAVATCNVENLAGNDPQSKYDDLAERIVGNLRSPDIIGIEEVQDNDGVAGGTGSPVVDASVPWTRLIQAIQQTGGPLYEYRQIDPVDDAEGGAPGGNIRVGFLFRADRGVEFIDRPGGGPTTETAVVAEPSGPRLSSSPGRIGTQSAAFDDTRKSLVGEFRARGKTLFVVVNHFSSKGDDQPLFGPAQPPTRFSEIARHGQAQVVHDFVADLLTVDPRANVIVLGDINDFEFSATVDILEAGGGLHSLVQDLPPAERYSYVFEGNSQVLDQILFSPNLRSQFPHDYDVVHVNSEFADAIQASDHEPSVTRLDLRGRPTPKG
jgi:uncharacterized protein